MPRTSQVELPGCPRLRVLCCDSLGLIKVVETEADGGVPKVVARWGDPNPQQGIRCASLSSDALPMLAVARKTNTVQVLEPVTGTIQSELAVPDDSAGKNGQDGREVSSGISGLHMFSESSNRGRAVLTCAENGDAVLQRLDNGAEVSPQSRDEKDPMIAKWNISQTGTLLCMSVDVGEEHAVFGGKGVDVNVWDTGKISKLWSGKAPHRDNLGLISPAWVTAVTFLSKDDHRKIVVGTGHHQIRLYDIGAQRRPTLAFDYGESPIKTVTRDPDGNSVFVGTGGGDMACFDMRTGKMVGAFKGKCSGSIRSVSRHPTLPLIASCGLDRYLRIHNTKTRQLLASLFLKQQLVTVMFDTKQMPPVGQTPGSGVVESGAVGQSKLEQGTEADSKKRSRLVERNMNLKRPNKEQTAANPEPVGRKKGALDGSLILGTRKEKTGTTNGKKTPKTVRELTSKKLKKDA